MLIEEDRLSAVSGVVRAQTFIKNRPWDDELMAGRFFAEERPKVTHSHVVILIVSIVKTDQEASINADLHHQDSSTALAAVSAKPSQGAALRPPTTNLPPCFIEIT